MPVRKLLPAALAALIAIPAVAMDGAISVEDPYARTSRPAAPTGAAFMTLVNGSDQDDRLIAAQSDAAARVEIHTHVEDASGVMRMVEVEDGIALPAGVSHSLKRGGDHIMFIVTGEFPEGSAATSDED